MFNNVLVGVDGRQGGRDAIALALRLAHPDATVALADVYAGMYMPSHAVTPGRVREDREAAEQLVERARSQLDREVEIAVKQSTSPARGLHELAEARQADLLVLGSCHRGAFGRAMLGNDTRAGLNGAPCAVAVATHGFATGTAPFASIGVAYNATPESELALRSARELAARTGARIRALQIVTAPAYLFSGIMPPAGPGIDELVKAAEAKMGTLDGVETTARYGAIDIDLEEFSKQVDLLVMGSRGYGPGLRMIEGSTSHYLLGHSRAPLLVLPRGARTSQPETRRLAATSELPASV
jgi:nucleotide-binding universal stress UspA family protein